MVPDNGGSPEGKPQQTLRLQQSDRYLPETQKTAGPTFVYKRRNPRLINSITGISDNTYDYCGLILPLPQQNPLCEQLNPDKALLPATGILQIPEKLTVGLQQHHIAIAPKGILIGSETARE